MTWAFQPGAGAAQLQLAGNPPLVADAGEFAVAGQDFATVGYRMVAEHGIFHADGRAFSQPYTAAMGVKVVTFGDSIMEGANGHGSPDITILHNRSSGEINWVRQRGKASFRYEIWADASARWIHNGVAFASAPLFNGANQGHAGDWSRGLLRRIDAVINMDPDIVVLSIGTNGGPVEDGSGAADVISHIGQIVNILTTAGIKVVVGTVRPRATSLTGASGTFPLEQSPGFRTRINTINAFIRTLDNDSTVFVWDPEPDLLDPNPTAPLVFGSIYRLATRDGVHLSAYGAQASSRTLDLTLDRLVADGTWFDPDPTVDNFILNGQLAGTGGTVGAGWTGQVPNSHTTLKVGVNPLVTGVTAVSGGVWSATLTSAGDGVVGSPTQLNVFKMETATITVASQGWTPTTWLKAFVEIEVSDESRILGDTELNFYFVTPGPSIVRSAGMLASPGPGAGGSRVGWIETVPHQVGGSVLTVKVGMDLDVKTYVAGTATVKIRRWMLREAADPHLEFPYDPMNPQIYAVSGQNVIFTRTGSVGIPNLIADGRVMTVAGQAVGLAKFRILSADHGRFAALGNGSSVLVDEQGAWLIDEQGAVLIVEEDPVEFRLVATRILAMDGATFSLTGQDAVLFTQTAGVYMFAAEGGVFELAGQDADPAVSSSTALEEGIFAFLGGDVDLIKALAALDAESGLFQFRGETLEFRRDLLADTLYLTVTGSLEFSVFRRRVYIHFGTLVRTPGRIYPGTTIQINGTFNDEVGFPIDPIVVSLRVATPRGPRQTYVYGRHPEIRKNSDGRYIADIVLDQPGRWHYRWECLASDIVSMKEGTLLVQETPFYSYPRIAYGG